MAVWSEVTLSTIENIRLDAEYYQPKYLQAKAYVGNYKLKNYGVVVIHPTEVKRNYSSNGLRIVLAQNNRDNFYNWSENRYMDERIRKSIERNKLSFGDVTVTRSGANFGQTSVITIEPAKNEFFACADLLILKSEQISGCLLSTYLNSKIGRRLMQRGVYGAGQPHIAPSYVKEIPFPTSLLTYAGEIDGIVIKSRKLTALSQSLYTQAQQLLEHELGLDKLKFEKPVGYEASFSEVVNNNRADADYYQTKFRSLEKHIRNINTKPLSQIANFTKGIEVGSSAYTDEGKLFLRVSNVKETGIETGSSDKYINNNLFSSLQIFQPEINELLLTKDGTPGICYVVDEIIDGIISGGIVKIKIINTSIPSEYLALVINSKICRMQVERVCSGALIVHWKPGDISKLQIPILSDGMMKKLSKLVAKSKQAKRESQQLLNQAKTRVEQLIEEAAGKNE